MRGDGFLYERNGTWWACFWRDGKRIRESLHTADKELAATRLQKLRHARERGSYLSPTERRVFVDELLDDLLRNLKLRGTASLKSDTSHAKAIREALGHQRAATLDTATIERAQADWKEAGVAPATINNRCEVLRRAYRLASMRRPPKVLAVPHVPMLKLENARQGFVSRADFEALLRGIKDPDLRDFVEWAWWTAMRKGESAQLTWEMFDKETWTLRLHASAEKARKGRVLALTGPLRKIMERRLKARLLACPLVFHVAGEAITDFRDEWAAAAAAARLPEVLFHDLRRSAIRNMVKGGVDPAVAMKISGHRTRAVFDRYHIVREDDLREAIERTEAYVSTLPARQKVVGLKQTGHNVADGKGKGRRREPGGPGSR